MRLQYKILLCVLPVMLVCIFGLGLWSYWQARSSLYDHEYEDMGYFLRIAVADQMKRRHELLVTAGLDGIASFVSSYQQEAMTGLKETAADIGQDFAILTGEGVPIFSSRLSDPSALGDWEPTARSVRSSSGQAQVGRLIRAGEPVLYTARYFEPWDWVVFICIPEKAVLASVGTIRTATLGIAGLSTLATVLLLLIISRHLLLAPIGVLKDASFRIAHQERLDEIPIYSRDELGGLARDMEIMSKSIDGFINDLRSTGTALEESEARFRDFAEAASDWFWETDADLRFTFVSDRIEEVLGVPPDHLLGKTRWEVGGAEGAETNWEQHKEDLRQCRSFRNFVYSIRHPREKPNWVSVNGSPRFDHRGRFIGYRGTATDITARKQAEDALEQKAEELARSNQELEQFASVASHDLQEPLRKVQAFGDRLHSNYATVLDEQGLDYLARMQKATARMQTLIHDLLVFSRVTTKGEPFVAVDLGQVVQDVLSDLEVRVLETDAEVVVGPLPSITADPLQMRQLLQNLIGNALKYHREGVAPAVRIEAEVEDPEPGQWLSTAGPICRIRISDNGIGFEDEYAERIFGIFQRLHGRGAYEGTGVGLAICRKIAERHGGSIEARGRPEEGATFTIHLPVSPAGQGARAA